MFGIEQTNMEKEYDEDYEEYIDDFDAEFSGIDRDYPRENDDDEEYLDAGLLDVDYDEFVDGIERVDNWFEYSDGYKLCVICQKPITPRFWICRDCEKNYDLLSEAGKLKKPLDWPNWIREIYNHAQRQYYQWRTSKEITFVSFDDFEEFFSDDDWYGD